MNADKAREMVKAHAKKVQRAEQYAKTKEERAYRERERKEVARYPQILAEITHAIETAAKSGYNNVVVDKKWLNVTHDQLEKDLTKRGFKLQTHYHDGHYEDYGDFNAPCNVWQDAYQTWTISWLAA